jgi:hypothetical protein
MSADVRVGRVEGRPFNHVKLEGRWTYPGGVPNFESALALALLCPARARQTWRRTCVRFADESRRDEGDAMPPTARSAHRRPPLPIRS